MAEQDEMTLVDYWVVIRKRVAGIAGLVILSSLAALVVSLLLPKIYEGRASILAPKESGAGGGQALAAALAASAGAQFLGGILPPTGSNRDIFVSILKSDTMARDVVRQFNLVSHYRAKYTSQAVQALQGNTAISVSKEGAISITTQHTDPRTAADMANFYVENLDRLFAKLGMTDASRQRAFIRERLEKTQADLRGAEEALRRFQESNKAVVLQEQSKAAIEAAAKLKGEIAAADVQLQVLRTFATERNPDVVRLEKRLGEMKNQLGKMQFGTGLDLPDEQSDGGRTRKEIFVPAVRVPRVGLDLARLMREVKIQETIFQLLTSQLEQAKIAEARDTAVVQVLDRPVVPDRKSKPKVLMNVGLAGALSILLGVFGALFLEHLETARRMRDRHLLADDGASTLHSGYGKELPRSPGKALAEPDSDEVSHEEDDAVDVGQLRFSSLAPDGEGKGTDRVRVVADPARAGRAKK